MGAPLSVFHVVSFPDSKVMEGGRRTGRMERKRGFGRCGTVRQLVRWEEFHKVIQINVVDSLLATKVMLD